MEVGLNGGHHRQLIMVGVSEMRRALLEKLFVVHRAILFEVGQIQRKKWLHFKAQKLANVRKRFFLAVLEFLEHGIPRNK